MHFDAAKKLDMAELAACADIKEDRAIKAAETYGITSYTDYKEKAEFNYIISLPNFIIFAKMIKLNFHPQK